MSHVPSRESQSTRKTLGSCCRWKLVAHSIAHYLECETPRLPTTRMMLGQKFALSLAVGLVGKQGAPRATT